MRFTAHDAADAAEGPRLCCLPLVSTVSPWPCSGHTGSALNMSPEVFRQHAYNEQVDTFSFGGVLFEIFGRVSLAHWTAGRFKDAHTFAFEVGG